MFRTVLLSFALILGFSSVGFSQAHGHGHSPHANGYIGVHGGLGLGTFNGYGAPGATIYGFGGYPMSGFRYGGPGYPGVGFGGYNFAVPANLDGFYRPMPMNSINGAVMSFGGW